MESLKTWRLAACKQLLSTGVFDGPVDSSSKRGVQGGDSGGWIPFKCITYIDLQRFCCSLIGRACLALSLLISLPMSRPAFGLLTPFDNRLARAVPDLPACRRFPVGGPTSHCLV